MFATTLIAAAACISFSFKVEDKKVISVSFTYKSSSCPKSTDCSWGLSEGTGLPDDFRKASEKAAKSKCSSSVLGVDSYDNWDWSEELGNYVTIISSNVSDYNECTVFKYGVGFGHSQAESLTRAKDNLASRHWSWSEKKHGYTVVHNDWY